MEYIPFNYDQINLGQAYYTPSNVNVVNNASYALWQRALFQRASSNLIFNLPEEWQGNVRDFFMYCLYRFGYIAVFKTAEHGTIFQPGTLNGYNIYYQPVDVTISNPGLPMVNRLTIGKDCELIKLTPDYKGIWDIISYYAEKLSTLDNALNMSLINSKFAFMLAAKNKNAAEALKLMLDKINEGQPAVVYSKDALMPNDPDDKEEPYQLISAVKDLKSNYITTDLLMDLQTILNNFDAEVGIPSVPYQKKERLVTAEAESRVLDSTSRSTIWKDCLESSIKKVNAMFGLDISVELRYNPDEMVDSQDAGTEEEGDNIG